MKMPVSERAQTIMLWWGLIFMYIYGTCMFFLLKMMPPPDANLTAEMVAAFYQEHSRSILIGAMITSWTAAFAVPFITVGVLQLIRLESKLDNAFPAWSLLAFAGGLTMTMFLVFPPILWGVAAFTPDRPAEVTTIIHELGLLTLTTTDQYYIFNMVAIGIVSLKFKNHDAASGWPRWLGYFTLWAALAFEVGALAFMFKTGPFSWNGVMVFWMPLVVYGAWITVVSAYQLHALKLQAKERRAADKEGLLA